MRLTEKGRPDRNRTGRVLDQILAKTASKNKTPKTPKFAGQAKASGSTGPKRHWARKPPKVRAARIRELSA
jgi:hypothetical protein